MMGSGMKATAKDIQTSMTSWNSTADVSLDGKLGQSVAGANVWLRSLLAWVLVADSLLKSLFRALKTLSHDLPPGSQPRKLVSLTSLTMERRTFVRRVPPGQHAAQNLQGACRALLRDCTVCCISWIGFMAFASSLACRGIRL